MFSDFTTFAPGKARWICSASESVLQTESVGGVRGEVERIGHVDHDLPIEVLRTSSLMVTS